ncbi:MAG: polyprenyl synthetase family protein [Bacteroidales bacterium]|jgi:geranylgeranyl diphosphate synthase type II|nr:polyprenyl synthetase family protein [Bacteroidales bacterium]
MSLAESYGHKVEEGLLSLLGKREPAGLYEPVDYILSIGGKRIRPVLCMMGCALYKEEEVDKSLFPALGMEVFHNFTLLHDDIMDRSEMRRNRPTVHVKWDERTAILSGDAMLILAYQLIARTSAAILPRVLELFNRTGLEVCEGQRYDLSFETRNDITEEAYLEMIKLKTAVLLGASLQVGAIIGGASDADACSLYRFGNDAGMAFQLQDDWLDVYGDAGTFGKPIGGDIIINKKTFLLINAYNNLSSAGRAELTRWIDKKEFDRDEKIAAVRNLYDEAGVSGNAKKLMDSYYQQSLVHLEKAGGSDELRDELKAFAFQLMERSR